MNFCARALLGVLSNLESFLLAAGLHHGICAGCLWVCDEWHDGDDRKERSRDSGGAMGKYETELWRMSARNKTSTR